MKYFVSDLKENLFFSSEAFLDGKFILLTNFIPISASLINSLIEWDFTEIQSEGKLISQEILNDPIQLSMLEMENDSNGLLTEAMRTVKEKMQDGNHDIDEQKNIIAQTVYDKSLEIITDHFINYSTAKKLNFEVMVGFVKDFYNFVLKYEKNLLQLKIPKDSTNEQLLIHHALRSTIFSLLIGKALQIADNKLLELGIAAIFHEIGMIRLSPQMYTHDNTLSASERQSILVHPIHSYNILKSSEFPANICLAVLDHHERQDGSGYPRRIRGNQISAFAKIIAVACAYEAITAPRAYQPARGNHEGVIELLRNTKKQFDPVVVKALLSILTIFPIGTYVKLTTGQSGIVVDVNPDFIKMPVVKLISQDDSSEVIYIKTYECSAKIERALTNKEIGTIKKRNQVVD